MFVIAMRFHPLSTPGKKSTSLVLRGLTPGSGVIWSAPSWLCIASSTVSGRSSCCPESDRPPRNQNRMNLRKSPAVEYRPWPPMSSSGSSGEVGERKALRWPSAVRTCRFALRSSICDPRRKVVSRMPNGVSRRSVMTAPSRRPVAPSMTLPNQSRFVPYSHRVPGSNISGACSDACVAVATSGRPRPATACAQSASKKS
ncbi:Uncharacterised protein [Mycobacteroides abscessus subsp. abscessus]|nr:Uncharacterised protein [Mycobacteroides abscessus subsp. abscessus]